MNLTFGFFLTSILFGICLAMDAFSVSLANGLNEPKMKTSKIYLISGTFAFFQFLMPLLGWACIHTIAEHFETFEKLIPYIALILLLYIGINMIKEGREIKSVNEKSISAGFGSLIVQGIATSIDALSVGFANSSYDFGKALLSSLIIGVFTFVICCFGVLIGKKFGTSLSGKASVFGGIILIFIGLEIFISGII